MAVVKARLYIIQYGKLFEQPDILEGSCDAFLIYFNCIMPCELFPVKEKISHGRLVYTGQKIECGGFACPVGTDKTVKPAFFYLQAESVNSL